MNKKKFGPEGKQLLESLAKFLIKYNGMSNAEHVWNVLCALRGPDHEDQALKLATTGLVRRAILGCPPVTHLERNEISGKEIGEWGVTNRSKVTVQDTQALVAIRLGPIQVYDCHFMHHAIIAFKALDLEWSKVNDMGKFDHAERDEETPERSGREPEVT